MCIFAICAAYVPRCDYGLEASVLDLPVGAGLLWGSFIYTLAAAGVVSHREKILMFEAGAMGEFDWNFPESLNGANMAVPKC
jgi:hypothetical protein